MSDEDVVRRPGDRGGGDRGRDRPCDPRRCGDESRSASDSGSRWAGSLVLVLAVLAAPLADAGGDRRRRAPARSGSRPLVRHRRARSRRLRADDPGGPHLPGRRRLRHPLRHGGRGHARDAGRLLQGAGRPADQLRVLHPSVLPRARARPPDGEHLRPVPADHLPHPRDPGRRSGGPSLPRHHARVRRARVRAGRHRHRRQELPDHPQGAPAQRVDPDGRARPSRHGCRDRGRRRSGLPRTVGGG